MKYICSFMLFSWLALVANISFAAEPVITPSNEKKSPRSLLAVDPYDIEGAGLDPFDIDGKSALDPYDVDNFEIDSRYITPIMQAAPVIAPAIQQAPFIQDEKNSDEKTRWKTPKIYNDIQQAWNLWQPKSVKSKPPVMLADVGMQLGAGYVGAFGGSVMGLFGGFVAGSVYGELANCNRCRLDIAAGGSTLGAGLLSSVGVYIFGNNENQLGSMYATFAGSMVPVLLAESLYNDSKQIRKSGFYLLTMPLFATLGYNLSRHTREPGEKPWIKNIFIDESWVSADPLSGTVALNFQKRF